MVPCKVLWVAGLPNGFKTLRWETEKGNQNVFVLDVEPLARVRERYSRLGIMRDHFFKRETHH